MIGDSVNLGSRLEGINKEFGTYTMCSKSLKDAAVEQGANIQWRELARVSVVGKKSVITVYEPFLEEKYKVLQNDCGAIRRILIASLI